MRRHVANAGWGVLDYAAYPAMMFVVAPVVLHRLGASEYGIWSVTTAVISIGGVIASGFGDASIQRVARLRGHEDAGATNATAKSAMVQTVRSLLSLHLALGTMLALIAWCAVPVMAVRLAHAQPAQTRECVIALRIASALILLRALETVPVSTQRAFEQFGSAVRINTGVRLVTLMAAAMLALAGRHVVSMLMMTAAALAIGTVLQYRELQRLLGADALYPALDRAALHTLLRTGFYLAAGSWRSHLRPVGPRGSGRGCGCGGSGTVHAVRSVRASHRRAYRFGFELPVSTSQPERFLQAC